MSYDSEWRGIDDDEKEEEEGEYEHTWVGGRDALLLLIDTTDPMFIKKDGESAFELSMKCARNVMSNKIFSSDKDLVGIVFFGTKITKNSADFKHITVFQDLDQPDAEKILEIEKLMEDNSGYFEKTYGHSNDFTLQDVLWICSTIFSNCTMNLQSKRILLFTNTDDPHKGNSQLQRQARQKASDLYDIGIELDLLHIKKSNETFDVNKFYKDLIYLSNDEDYVNIQDPSQKLDELMSRIRAKVYKKRPLSSVPFSLSKDIKFGVSIYSFTRSMNLPTAVKLNKMNNEELKTIRKTFLSDTGELLLPSDIKKYQIFSGKKIALEQEEVQDLKRFFDPGLVLMGFKPKDKLKDYYHIKPAHFIYPDEENIQGSTALFAALLKKCIERNVIPICHLTPRRNFPPRFVALLPQEEELTQNNVQVIPPGFNLLHLPFSDDIRPLNIENPFKANEEQIDKAKRMLKKIRFKFDSESFENPVLQTHWNNIEALALDRDKPEKIVDYTIPDYEMMTKRLGALDKEFKASVYPDDYDPKENKGKRKNEGGAGKSVKKVKLENEETITVNIQKEAENGTLNKWTVNVLKEFCQSVGIKTTGLKKAQLIDAINEFLKINH